MSLWCNVINKINEHSISWSLQYIINTYALSSTQIYPNGEGDDNSHRGIGEAKTDIKEREVQEEIDSAPPDMVI